MKKELLLKYWICPFCNVAVPLFRPFPNMWRQRIKNHLLKCHLDVMEDNDYQKYLTGAKSIKR